MSPTVTMSENRCSTYFSSRYAPASSWQGHSQKSVTPSQMVEPPGMHSAEDSRLKIRVAMISSLVGRTIVAWAGGEHNHCLTCWISFMAGAVQPLPGCSVGPWLVQQDKHTNDSRQVSSPDGCR